MTALTALPTAPSLDAALAQYGVQVDTLRDILRDLAETRSAARHAKLSAWFAVADGKTDGYRNNAADYQVFNVSGIESSDLGTEILRLESDAERCRVSIDYLRTVISAHLAHIMVGVNAPQ